MKSWRINVILFLLTCLTTLSSGALLAGYNVFENPLFIRKGFSFSLALLGILACHEFGHYFYAKKHGVNASLPYFIPIPPPLTLIGTFGAFIKIKDQIPNRTALLQIGASGPIAGFIVAMPVLIYGLMNSSIVNLEEVDTSFYLGESIIFKLLTWIIYPELNPEMDLMLHPVAFAGWIGLLVTAINLLPMGQLDGGHIAYAILGIKHKILAKITFIILLIWGIFISTNWLVWSGIILLLMRNIYHSPILHFEENLARNDVLIGVFSLIILILCFIPIPFKFNG